MGRERLEPLAVFGAINQVWSMDFVHDQLSFPLFNVLDDFKRQGLHRRRPVLPSVRVIRSLEKIIE